MALVAWAALVGFGAFGLGSAATGIGSTITLVGLGVSAALTVTGIVAGRRLMRRLEQRALAAYPDPTPAAAPGPDPDDRVLALGSDD
jgi:hypothetical protein